VARRSVACLAAKHGLRPTVSTKCGDVDQPFPNFFSEPARGTAKRCVATSLAGDDRACVGHGVIRLTGELAVVDCGRTVAVGSGESREAASHAEANGADLAGAIRGLVRYWRAAAMSAEARPYPDRHDHLGSGDRQPASDFAA
jgi:hypothetical protein